MPIYEYRCRECGDKFEKLVRSSTGEKEVRCPACDSQIVERQVSVCGFIGGATALGATPSAGSCAPSGGG